LILIRLVGGTPKQIYIDLSIRVRSSIIDSSSFGGRGFVVLKGAGRHTKKQKEQKTKKMMAYYSSRYCIIISGCQP
jgi:hypothetical protein